MELHSAWSMTDRQQIIKQFNRTDIVQQPSKQGAGTGTKNPLASCPCLCWKPAAGKKSAVCVDSNADVEVQCVAVTNNELLLTNDQNGYEGTTKSNHKGAQNYTKIKLSDVLSVHIGSQAGIRQGSSPTVTICTSDPRFARLKVANIQDPEGLKQLLEEIMQNKTRNPGSHCPGDVEPTTRLKQSPSELDAAGEASPTNTVAVEAKTKVDLQTTVPGRSEHSPGRIDIITGMLPREDGAFQGSLSLLEDKQAHPIWHMPKVARSVPMLPADQQPKQSLITDNVTSSIHIFKTASIPDADERVHPSGIQAEQSAAKETRDSPFSLHDDDFSRSQILSSSANNMGCNGDCEDDELVALCKQHIRAARIVLLTTKQHPLAQKALEALDLIQVDLVELENVQDGMVAHACVD